VLPHVVRHVLTPGFAYSLVSPPVTTPVA
jgi:hypothetical protein